MAPRSPQRSLLLDAAKHLMLTKGYFGTTVDEVCASAGVTKGSFYHHFESKEALALALIDHYFSEVEAVLTVGPFVNELDPSQCLALFLEHAVQMARLPEIQEGCILGCFTLELSQTAPTIRNALENRFTELGEWLAALIGRVSETRPASAAGSTIPAEALAREFIAVLEGGIILSKAHGRPEFLAESLETYARLLLGHLES